MVISNQGRIHFTTQIHQACLQLRSLILTRALKHCSGFSPDVETISSPFLRKGQTTSGHLTLLPYGIVVERSSHREASLLITQSSNFSNHVFALLLAVV